MASEKLYRNTLTTSLSSSQLNRDFSRLFFFSQKFFIFKRQTRNGGKYEIRKICSRATQNIGTCKYFKKNQTFFIDLGYVKLTSFWKQEYKIINSSEQQDNCTMTSFYYNYQYPCVCSFLVQIKAIVLLSSAELKISNNKAKRK